MTLVFCLSYLRQAFLHRCHFINKRHNRNVRARLNRETGSTSPETRRPHHPDHAPGSLRLRDPYRHSVNGKLGKMLTVKGALGMTLVQLDEP